MPRLTSLMTVSCCVLIAAASARASDEGLAKQIADLASENSTVRSKAIDEIAKHGSRAKPAVGALIKVLSSDDAGTRWRAARTIGAIGPEAGDAVPALTLLLKDDESRVRAYAAFALGRIGEASRPAAKSLVPLGLDKDPLVRRAVVDALLRIRAPIEDTLPLVLQMLERAEPAEVQLALHAMADAGEKAVPRLREVLKQEKGCYWACLVLADIGPAAKEAVPELIPLIKHPEEEVRMQALVALGEIGPAAKSAESAIAAALEKAGEFKEVRYAAAYALGAIGQKELANTVLREAIDCEDEFLRVVSAWALAKLNPDNAEMVLRCAKQIVKGLKSKDEHVRMAAARALAESNAPSEIVAPALVEALSEADEKMIEQAVDALASLGPKAVPRTIRGLKNDKLKWLAVEVLARMGPEAKGAVPALVEALVSDEDDEYRREVGFALGAIGPEAAEATPALIKALSDHVDEVCYSACYVLGKIGPAAKEAAPALAKNLKSDDEFLQLTSVWALLRILPGNVRVAKVATPLLTRALEDERESVRAEAAAALGDIGGEAKAAVPALEKALNDESSAVRSAAAESLEKIQR